MDLGIADHAFIVTGGTQGLGRAVAQTLVDEGARVVVASRSQDHVDQAVGALGERATGLAVDLAETDAPKRLLDTCLDAFGRFDGAFISYGGPPAGPATALDDRNLLDAIAKALVPPVRLVRDFAAALGEGGSIVALTSSSQDQPIPGLAGSNVTRPGIWGYVKTIADEVGPRGVRVNTLIPGRYTTGRVAELEADIASRTGKTVEEIRSGAEQTIPLRRLGDPTELGRVAAFLLSPAASYVTGAAITVDGGAIRGL